MGPFGDFAKQFIAIFSGGSPVGPDNPLPIAKFNSLVPEMFDYVAMTYVAAGNGAGEIETATYKTGGAAGATVAVLTMTYNASNQITSVTKT